MRGTLVFGSLLGTLAVLSSASASAATFTERVQAVRAQLDAAKRIPKTRTIQAGFGKTILGISHGLDEKGFRRLSLFRGDSDRKAPLFAATSTPRQAGLLALALEGPGAVRYRRIHSFSYRSAWRHEVDRTLSLLEHSEKNFKAGAFSQAEGLLKNLEKYADELTR
jgi:hypothetical protein